jgi:hypothetical protein
MRTSILTLGFCSVATLSQAQVGEAGEITTRSDVRMAVEGTPGTIGKRLDALANSLGTPLGEIKRCYADLVKLHPETVGELAVKVEVPVKGPTKITAPGAVQQLKPMQHCVDHAFARMNVSQVPRPAGVQLTLSLTNSAAASASEVKAQGAQASKVDVEKTEDGMRAAGHSLGGEVFYTVQAHGSATEHLVEYAAKEVRSALPGLFDCRRRASKLGSPEGDITLHLKLSQGARASVDAVSSTVSNERAPNCVTSVLKRNLKPGAKGTVTLTVHFSPPVPENAG